MNRAEAEVRVWRSSGLRPVCLLVVWLVAAATARGQPTRETAPAEQTQRIEGEAILALADAALEEKPVPEDFELHWHNEFLKAHRGTFLPFTLTIDTSRLTRPAVLVYVRAVRRETPAPVRRERIGRNPARLARERREPQPPEDFPVDAIFPVELSTGPGQRARVSRGFSLAPGAYDVIVVVRERLDPAAGELSPRAAVLKRPLDVPDFADGLTTSSIILADRLDVQERPIEPEELAERPYVIGRHVITPAADRLFKKTEELVVVFLVYNPFVTTDKKFDLQVEYHFFRRNGGPAEPVAAGGDRPAAQAGERYFNHTDPQRFNPAVLGPQFDPASGNPVMAGQGVPLSGFEDGEYRLAIRITDLLAGKSIMRDVHFTVGW